MNPVIIRTFDNYFQANIYLTRLQAAGVPCRLFDENSVTTVPFLSNVLGGIKLVVNEADKERARQLINRFDNEPPEALKCPNCGSKNYVELTKEDTTPSTSILYRLADDYPLQTTTGFRCFDCDYHLNFGEADAATYIDVKKNVVAVIPARYASTRFPYKLMQPLGGKTVIRQTHDNVLATGLFDEVLVVTDHETIFNEVTRHGGKSRMSEKTHESGSDRIAEAIQNLDVDIIINIQGDEPFVNKKALAELIAVFKDEEVKVASLMKPFANAELVQDPNYVKVVADEKMNSLYFSRSPIPYNRDGIDGITYYEHIGAYAYRKEALLQFTAWPPSPLEMVEKLEQLRYLHHGISLRMVVTETASVKIDVPADLAVAEEYWQRHFGDK